MRSVQRMFVVATLVLTACGKGGSSETKKSNETVKPADPDELTADELRALAAHSPLPAVPADPTNAYADDPRAAKLGQMLFFDEALAGPLVVESPLGRVGELGKLSCRTCHAGPALDDQHSKPNHVSIGTAITGRNAPPVLNSVFYKWTNWGGRFDSQWALVMGAAEKADVMNGNRLAIAHVVFAKYRAEYDELFPDKLDAALDPAAKDAARFPPAGKPSTGKQDAWEAMKPADRESVDRIFVNVGKAVAAYMRKLVARNAPFDRYVAGDRAAIGADAKRGIRLFVKHCKVCHDGPHFTDDKFHAIGIAQFGANVPEHDAGRFGDVPPLLASPFNTAGKFSDGPGRLAGLAQTPEMKGQFRTPSLRNVAVTAPYMHAGQIATLEAVVTFYNIGGGHHEPKSELMKPLGLTDQQQADLVAFMKALTDTNVDPALLADTSR